jgi:hypothetical protein
VSKGLSVAGLPYHHIFGDNKMAMFFGLILQVIGVCLGCVCVFLATAQMFDPEIVNPALGIDGAACIELQISETLCGTLPTNTLDPNLVPTCISVKMRWAFASFFAIWNLFGIISTSCTAFYFFKHRNDEPL